MAKKLLLNADDLGLSSAINAGIIQAHTNGIVTSTSIVAAGEAFDEAVQLSKLHPTLGVGVHLTLIEENPVSQHIPILPRTYGDFAKKVATGQIRLRDIELEFRAQVEKCLLAGLNPTHLDSHQHTHVLPLIFPIAVRVANSYEIPGIRIPRAIPRIRDISSNRFLGKCALCLFAHCDAACFRLGKCKTTHHFAGLFESGALTDAVLLNILSNLDDGTTELCCHPALDDPSPRYARWNNRRQVELASLTSSSVKEAVQKLGIELISYRQL